LEIQKAIVVDLKGEKRESRIAIAVTLLVKEEK